MATQVDRLTHAAMIERCGGYYATSPTEANREQLRRTEAFLELC